MLKNYFKTAFRNLATHKGNTMVNIGGLMVGFAAFLMIFLVIQYEQSFDDFHKNKSSIYRVVRIGRNPVNREYRTGVPMPVTAALRKDFPQLTNVSAIASNGGTQIIVAAADGSAAKRFKEDNGVFFAEPQFFKMFDFSLAMGDINSMNAPSTVLLTKDIATKYFGDWKIAMGKVLKLDRDNYKVTGILNNIPVNTDFPLKAVISYKTITEHSGPDNWDNIDDDNYCLVQLTDNNQAAQFGKLLDRFTDKHIKPVNPGYTLALQPLSEIHYDERYGNFNGRTFSKDLIVALSLIGLFLLIVACVNFINLTTAQAINRAREVGVRKVLGGSRKQLIVQFLGETGITSLFALLGSLIIVVVCIPFVNNLLEVSLAPSILYSGQVIAFMFGALIVVTLLSGFYPALVLSGFNPVAVLKGAKGSDSKAGVYFRRGLVVFQFVIAQMLIIGTLVVVSQMDYFRTADMGFNKEAIINAGFPRDSLSRTRVGLLRNELLKTPGVENVSFSLSSPSSNQGTWATDLRVKGNNSKSPDMIVSFKAADTGFFRLYNLPLVAGRVYFPSDTMKEFVVNETVVKRLGIKNVNDAIGMQINTNGKTCPIVGVVKDFHENSLRDSIGALVLTTMKRAYGLANIKINLSQKKPVLAAMTKIWGENFPEYTFEYQFLDQAIADYYKQENQLSQLYAVFSGIAIFISCLGLYGLVSFMAMQRKKEIGIRKVLGAPVANILVMLSQEFTLLITIAFVVASPMAWYFMHQWLAQYKYRISMGAMFFIGTIVGSLVIAWLTVGYTAIKAALANPVKSLRTE